MERTPRFLYPAVFLNSLTGIAYQIVLMRVLSIAQWHHFAYMIISIAMLGFGAGGTLLTLLRSRVTGREKECFFISLLLLAVSLPACYVAAQRIPFETFHLVTQTGQLGWLLAMYAVLAVPFFLVSVCITLAFSSLQLMWHGSILWTWSVRDWARPSSSVSSFCFRPRICPIC